MSFLVIFRSDDAQGRAGAAWLRLIYFFPQVQSQTGGRRLFYSSPLIANSWLTSNQSSAVMRNPYLILSNLFFFLSPFYFPIYFPIPLFHFKFLFPISLSLMARVSLARVSLALRYGYPLWGLSHSQTLSVKVAAWLGESGWVQLTWSCLEWCC